MGNAWSFLLAWLSARFVEGRVILRMEDLDPERSKPEFVTAIVQDLTWLGLDWDAGPQGMYTQSARGEYYQQALDGLIAERFAYPCYCTRKELRELASAPHHAVPYSHLQRWIGDAGAAYPGTCRNLTPAQRMAKEHAGRKASWRLASPDPDLVFSFTDQVLGPQYFSHTLCGGDFALRRSDGVWAYQLAVSVDDALMNVTQVVRGEDILISTPRQLLLFKLLGATAPSYAHIPLLHDVRGDRLAKRHQSLSLQSLREAGLSSAALVGWLAALAGFVPAQTALSPRQLLELLQRDHSSFPWGVLPSSPVIVPDTLLL